MARRERFLTREVVDRSKEIVKYHQHRTGIPTSAAPIFWDSWIEKVYANPDLETANEVQLEPPALKFILLLKFFC